MKAKITDQEIESVFRNTNFGGCDRRGLLSQGVLKRLCGYSCGSTLTTILHELGLTTAKGTVTKKGKSVAMDAFYRSGASA